MNLVHLDEVREHMISEIQKDIDAGKIYISERLSSLGRLLYPKVLLEAATNSNLEWFVESFGMENFNSHEHKKKPKGGFTLASIPSNANVTLCEGEFNRYYIRGVCLKALEMGKDLVTAYRARHSTNPRSESIALEGRGIDAKRLLENLRANPGVDTAMGLPPGPNSGMSVKI